MASHRRPRSCSEFEGHLSGAAGFQGQEITRTGSCGDFQLEFQAGDGGHRGFPEVEESDSTTLAPTGHPAPKCSCGSGNSQRAATHLAETPKAEISMQTFRLIYFSHENHI
jgi:hypothetical protein